MTRATDAPAFFTPSFRRGQGEDRRKAIQPPTQYANHDVRPRHSRKRGTQGWTRGEATAPFASA